jgi:phosphate transport system substrate-binding protein
MKKLAISSLFLCAACGGVLSELGVEDKGKGASPAASTSAKNEPTAQQGASSSAASLRLTGSNTIGGALAPKLAKAFLSKRGAKDVQMDESQRAKERVVVHGNLDGKDVAIDIWAPGTKQAFESLASGEADIGMASRNVKDEEAAKLNALGDMSSADCDHVVGVDGIAVIVNRANKVTKLSRAEIASIFSGDVSDWGKVGGGAGPIHLYVRDEKSGTFDAFSSMALKGKHIKEGAQAFADSEELSAAVAKDATGIGFIGLPYVKSAKALATYDGDGASPLYPTVFTVATEDYTLTRRLHFYTASAPKNPLARDFVEFALSEDGQSIVEDTGFVSLTVRAETPTVPAGAPEQYAKAVHDALRLSVSFRFKPNASTLDPKALRDLERVIGFLGGSKMRSKEVYLFGFTDKSGSDAANTELSKHRADAIGAELQSRGVSPKGVLGLGSAMPLAANDTPDGRERNRRVEVWIR